MKSLWMLSEHRRLEVQTTLDTLTQTSVYINPLNSTVTDYLATCANSMNIPQLLKARNAGFFKISFARMYGDSLQTLISQMGFDVRSAELTSIDAVQARSALSNSCLCDASKVRSNLKSLLGPHRHCGRELQVEV